MMMAVAGGRAKVTGKRRARAPPGPRPGKTPMRVPTKHPRKQKRRFWGWRAIPRP